MAELEVQIEREKSQRKGSEKRKVQ